PARTAEPEPASKVRRPGRTRTATRPAPGARSPLPRWRVTRTCWPSPSPWERSAAPGPTSDALMTERAAPMTSREHQNIQLRPEPVEPALQRLHSAAVRNPHGPADRLP